MTTRIFPGVYVQTRDLSDYAQVVCRTILGLVGVARKGPLHKPTIITSVRELVETFGTPPDMTTSLNERQRISVSGSGNFTLKFDGSAATSNIAVGASAATVESALEALSTIGSGNVAVTGEAGGPWVVEFIGDLAERDVVSFEVASHPTGGECTITVIEEGVSAASDYAMHAAIQFFEDGNQLLFTRTCAKVSDVWQATSAATLDAAREGSLRWDATSGSEEALTLSAGNAGEWGNDLQIRFTKLEGSQNEKQSLVFPTGTNGQNYTLTFDGGVTANIAYNTTAATHSANIKAALEALAEVGTDGVDISGSGTVADPFIVEFVGAKVGVQPWDDMIFTAGTYVGSCVIAEVQEGITPGSDVYRLDVLAPVDNKGIMAVVETYDRVMIVNNEATLATNDAYFMGTAVNSGIPGVFGKSRLPVEFDLTTFPTTTDDVKWSLVPGDIGDSATYTLEGGFSAMNCSMSGDADDLAASYIGTEVDATFNGPTALQALRNPATRDINIVAVPGVTNASVLTELCAIADERHDVFAILDTPEALNHSEAVDWHNRAGSYTATGFKPNTSQAGMYWNWQYVFDSYNSTEVKLPPSAMVPAVFAYNDRVGQPWYAPAGIMRGRVRKALRSEFSPPSLGALENMYNGANVLNPILDLIDDGITVYGQRTTQRRASGLDRINVSRMIIAFSRIAATVGRTVVMEPSDEVTWNKIIALLSPVLEQIKRGRGLYEFKVVCDRSTNTPAIRDQNKMKCVVWMQPVKAGEVLEIDVVPVPTGAQFDLRLLGQ